MNALSGHSQRLYIGAWLLATLLLAGYNGYRYLVLEDIPLLGQTTNTRSLRQKLNRFETLMTSRSTGPEDLSPFKSTFDRYVKKPDPIVLPEPPVLKETVAEKVEPPKAEIDLSPEVVLPVLSGIMRIQNERGDLHYQALLNGRFVEEKDRIDQFTIAEISPNSVVLSGFAKLWTLESPTPSHSSDLGE